jgi:hypothetical protein
MTTVSRAARIVEAVPMDLLGCEICGNWKHRVAHCDCLCHFYAGQLDLIKYLLLHQGDLLTSILRLRAARIVPTGIAIPAGFENSGGVQFLGLTIHLASSLTGPKVMV